MMGTSINSLFGRTAALRGANALRAQQNSHVSGRTFRLLRAVRLAFHPEKRISRSALTNTEGARASSGIHRAFVVNRSPRGAPAFVAALTCALVVACATPPPAALPTTAPAPRVMSRVEVAAAALKALEFEQIDDGYHLSLPAPLIFAFDSDAVADAARTTLTRVGRELQALGIERTLVRGHTDTVGSNEYNLGLSKRRADAVAKVLVEAGYTAGELKATESVSVIFQVLIN